MTRLDVMGANSTIALLAAAVRTEAGPCWTTSKLFEAHGALVLRLVRYLGVHDSQAEDVAQEVFVVAHRRLDTLQRNESARSWLFGIARRVAANHVRKTKRSREHTLAHWDVADSGDPAAELQLARDRALLTRALERLDDDKRVVFVLFELEGLTMQEIAEMVGCPLATAYSRLSAARQIVRRHVLASTRSKP
ncbi:MAG: RNA polymerase sigma factor [Polyangiales bacterium]